ncbi:MAG TPA: type I-C CRISPR-associated protein Cas8c/Csd1 [Armatimonadota bacterium]|jgi:CRISPR-associated protein Csd1
MSWLDNLCRTYENNSEHVGDRNDDIPLLPLFHSLQNAQVDVVLDGDGNFLRAAVVSKDDARTIIPATEESAGRSGGKIAPHALCDTLQYVAGDYLRWGGNPRKEKNESGFEDYIAGLDGWVTWSRDQQLRSVLTYLRKGLLISDLVEFKVLWASGEKLAERTKDSSKPYPIFKAVSGNNQATAFVRFSVEIPGDPQSHLWLSPRLRDSWRDYYRTSRSDSYGVCMVTGKTSRLAHNHPKFIRYPGDGAKLVSSNDSAGFTYRGKFTDAREACGIGVDITHKAHNALRWLIARQGYRDGDQAIVAWAISGANVPDPCADTFALLFGGDQDPIPTDSGYTAQEVGHALSTRIAGYSATLNNTDSVSVIGLDSATPGRMAIRYYRDLTASELLRRVQSWHEECSWLQRFGKDRVFVGAPAPRDIAEAAFGSRLDGNLRKATVERLLPCIVDGAPIPSDLVDSCVNRAANRNGIKPNSSECWEWEKSLGIACALFRYTHKERGYAMALNRERNSRDYLYGRLLALAEHLERRALSYGDEKRATNAEKLTQRFSDRPYATWLLLETALTPYCVRLSTKSPGFLYGVKREMDSVMDLFITDEFTCDRRLTGEFLLGYHCQRADLRSKPTKDDDDSDPNDDE